MIHNTATVKRYLCNRFTLWNSLKGYTMYELHGFKLDDFTRAYLECALWSSHDESTEDGGEPFDQNYAIEDISPESVAQAVADCEQFQRENSETLAKADWQHSDGDVAGHNFWLNRNGHGSGFWDEFDRLPDGVDREKLNQACEKFGSIDPVLGDDGKIYFE